MTLDEAVKYLNKVQYREYDWIVDYAGGSFPDKWALGIPPTATGQDLFLTEFEAIAVAEKLARQAVAES